MPNKPRTFRARASKSRRLSGSPTLRDHSAAYQRQRARILAQEPLCRYCRARGHVTAATILDHVLALCLGGSNEPANLAPSCQPCNAAKGRIEQRLATLGYVAQDARLDPELWEWLRLASIAPPKHDADRDDDE